MTVLCGPLKWLLVMYNPANTVAIHNICERKKIMETSKAILAYFQKIKICINFP